MALRRGTASGNNTERGSNPHRATMKLAENIVFEIQVVESYLCATPGVGDNSQFGRKFKDVWLRSKEVSTGNHSLYLDNTGRWWWYNDRDLIELLDAEVGHFGRHYNNPFLPPKEEYHSHVEGVIEVVKTTYLD